MKNLDKFNFPNLPQLIDGDSIISENTAIPIYIAQKYKKEELVGKEGSDRVKYMEVQGVILDLQKII